MLTIDLGEAAEVAVVDGSSLGQYLGDLTYGGAHGRGWKLIAVLEEDKLEHYNEAVPNPLFNANQGEYGSNVKNHLLQKVKKVRTHKFLLGKTRDEVLEDLNGKLATSMLRASQSEQDKKKAEEKLKELETKLASVVQEKERLSLVHSGICKDMDEKNRVLRSMELDISKVRSAVGTDRMKEIIGR